MNILEYFIEKKIQLNPATNIFSPTQLNQFDFIQSANDLVNHWKGQPMNAAEESRLIDNTVQRGLRKFNQCNQYYSFDHVSQSELKKIYQDFFIALRNAKNEQKVNDYAPLISDHFNSLQQWLWKGNVYARTLIPEQASFVHENIVCAEYSAEMQLEILDIQPENLIEPIIDVGCGQNAFLLRYLESLGMDVFGLDKNVSGTGRLIKGSWLEFKFEADTWGTIVSNLGFSNHFVYQHARQDSEYISYASKYMEILRALKKGGRFYYAPSLPFIEKYLDKNIYGVCTTAISNTPYNSVILERLK